MGCPLMLVLLYPMCSSPPENSYIIGTIGCWVFACGSARLNADNSSRKERNMRFIRRNLTAKDAKEQAKAGSREFTLRNANLNHSPQRAQRNTKAFQIYDLRLFSICKLGEANPVPAEGPLWQATFFIKLLECFASYCHTEFE